MKAGRLAAVAADVLGAAVAARVAAERDPVVARVLPAGITRLAATIRPAAIVLLVVTILLAGIARPAVTSLLVATILPVGITRRVVTSLLVAVNTTAANPSA